MKNKCAIFNYFFISLAVFFFLTPALFSNREDQERIFRVDGRDYKVAAQASQVESESDIILYRDGTGKNLSKDIPGANIFPEVDVHDGYFYVTWINHEWGNNRLCFYDSSLDHSRVLVDGGFHFIAAGSKPVFSGSLPAAVIFKGNNSDNDDLFCYGFFSGQIKKLTHTPSHIKEFNIILDVEYHGVIIESKTLYHTYLHRFDPESLKIKLLEKKKIIRPAPRAPLNDAPAALNRYITYGDSITWGKMRMNDLPRDPTKNYHHPELAYPQKIKDRIDADYGEDAVDYDNLSEPGDSTWQAAGRLYELNYYQAKFFLLMLGTNDAYNQQFSLHSSLENLAYIVDTARGYNMDVIISTIPPRNDRFNIPRVNDNIHALNAGIIDIANAKGIAYIDTHTAYMNYEPPLGWKKLLEDRDASDEYKPGSGGQHPSPLGHDVITGLFLPHLISPSPLQPGQITVSNTGSNMVIVQWQQNYEFDFSHYNIEFGYFPDKLNRSATSTTPDFTFLHPPFSKVVDVTVYFRIQSEDTTGHKSVFSIVYDNISVNNNIESSRKKNLLKKSF